MAATLLSLPLHGAQLKWFPRGDLPRPRVEPREPHMGIRLIGLQKGASGFGAGIEWEANFGHMVPFVRIHGEDPEHSVTLGIQGGVFGRFSFETRKRDLISSDWVFAAPLFITNGAHWIRVRYRHISAHLGDDYIVRFNGRIEGYLRDDIGVVVYRQVTPGVGMYGGGDVAFNVDPDRNKRLAFNGGIEFNVRRSAPTSWYGGIDLRVDQDEGWKPRVNLQAGTTIVRGARNSLRLILEYLAGPAPQRVFRRGTVRYFALRLVVDLNLAGSPH